MPEEKRTIKVVLDKLEKILDEEVKSFEQLSDAKEYDPYKFNELLKNKKIAEELKVASIAIETIVKRDKEISGVLIMKLLYMLISNLEHDKLIKINK